MVAVQLVVLRRVCRWVAGAPRRCLQLLMVVSWGDGGWRRRVQGGLPAPRVVARVYLAGVIAV